MSGLPQQVCLTKLPHGGGNRLAHTLLAGRQCQRREGIQPGLPSIHFPALRPVPTPPCWEETTLLHQVLLLTSGCKKRPRGLLSLGRPWVTLSSLARWLQSHCDTGSWMPPCGVRAGSPSPLLSCLFLLSPHYMLVLHSCQGWGTPMETQVVATSADKLLEAGDS